MGSHSVAAMRFDTTNKCQPQPHSSADQTEKLSIDFQLRMLSTFIFVIFGVKKRTPTSVQMHGATFHLKANSWPLFFATKTLFFSFLLRFLICRRVNNERCFNWNFVRLNLCLPSPSEPHECFETHDSSLVNTEHSKLFICWCRWSPVRWNSELGQKIRNRRKINFYKRSEEKERMFAPNAWASLFALFLANHFCFPHIFSIWLDSYA